MTAEQHRELIRGQTALQARVQPRSVRARHPENVTPMLDLAEPTAGDRALDVACGWGFVPLEFSGRVKSAAGVDLTPEMVALARSVVAERKAENVEIHLGDAEDLPFPSGAFEIVTCRFTMHHFLNPAKALSEMRRVLAPDGRVVMYDFIAHAGAAKAKRHNEIERARDPAHVRIHTIREFQELFRSSDLAEDARITTLWKRDFDSWMKIIGAGPEVVQSVRKMMEASMTGNEAGLGVRIRDGHMTFTHNCVAWRLTPKS